MRRAIGGAFNVLKSLKSSYLPSKVIPCEKMERGVAEIRVHPSDYEEKFGSNPNFNIRHSPASKTEKALGRLSEATMVTSAVDYALSGIGLVHSLVKNGVGKTSKILVKKYSLKHEDTEQLIRDTHSMTEAIYEFHRLGPMAPGKFPKQGKEADSGNGTGKKGGSGNGGGKGGSGGGNGGTGGGNGGAGSNGGAGGNGYDSIYHLDF